MPKKTQKPKPKKTQPKFKVTLETRGLKYTQQAESVEEAIINMGLRYTELKGKGVIKVAKGGKTYGHLFYPKRLKLVIGSKLTRRLWGERLEYLWENS